MNKKIAFLGTPEISAIFLEEIIKKDINISLVITNEDKIRSRNNKVVESEVASVAKKYNIEVFKPHKLNDDYSKLKELNPDLILTFAYGQILSLDVLKLSKYKPLNIHASLLPIYRGASPIQTAIKNGDKKTGISIIEMVKEMDKGDIFYQKEIEIDIKDNYSSLSKKIAIESASIIPDFLNNYFSNKIKPIKQDDNKATYCHYIDKEDYILSCDEDINSFINHVRYLAFNPGAYIITEKGNIKIYDVDYYSSEIKKEKGTLFIDNKNVLLQLKNGIVKINILQFPSKKIINSKDFINGFSKNEIKILSKT